MPQGTRLDSRYRVGDPVRVRIVGVEESGKRIRLAAEGVDEDTIALDRDRADPQRAKASRAPAETTSAPDEPFGTTLGDALRAALGNRDSSKDSTG